MFRASSFCCPVPPARGSGALRRNLHTTVWELSKGRNPGLRGLAVTSLIFLRCLGQRVPFPMITALLRKWDPPPLVLQMEIVRIEALTEPLTPRARNSAGSNHAITSLNILDCPVAECIGSAPQHCAPLVRSKCPGQEGIPNIVRKGTQLAQGKSQVSSPKLRY